MIEVRQETEAPSSLERKTQEVQTGELAHSHTTTTPLLTDVDVPH